MNLKVYYYMEISLYIDSMMIGFNDIHDSYIHQSKMYKTATKIITAFRLLLFWGHS